MASFRRGVQPGSAGRAVLCCIIDGDLHTRDESGVVRELHAYLVFPGWKGRAGFNVEIVSRFLNEQLHLGLVGYFSPRGYYEFGASNRTEGWRSWLTLSLPFGSGK